MGRNAKPVELLVLEGRTHLTKEQIERRKSTEIKLQNQSIRTDPLVLGDERALKEFKFLKKLFKEISFVGTLDSHIINQYCMSVSELDDMVLAMSLLRREYRGSPSDWLLNEITALSSEVRLKRSEIVKLADRLYLNPVARTKNLPKIEGKKEEDPNAGLFGDTG